MKLKSENDLLDVRCMRLGVIDKAFPINLTKAMVPVSHFICNTFNLLYLCGFYIILLKYVQNNIF